MQADLTLTYAMVRSGVVKLQITLLCLLCETNPQKKLVAAWKDMYLGVSKFVPSARTIEARLMGIFHEHMVASKIHHERSLPTKRHVSIELWQAACDHCC